MNPVAAVRTALLLIFCPAFTACDSSSANARAAALQFAFSWEQTVKAFRLESMSNLQHVEATAREIEPTRNVIRTEGSPAMWREAQQLDTLILYVAQCLHDNIKANIAQAQGSAGGEPIPVEFPNSAFNVLLGLKVKDSEKDGDDYPQKALSALHQAIDRFAAAARVGKKFDEAKRRREQDDASPGNARARSPAPSWTQIREVRIRRALERKALLIRERAVVEKGALAVDTPLGFAGTKFLMYPDEVKSIRPNATSNADGNLLESMEWLGRPAKVNYNFDSGFLVTAIVTFRDTATAAGFAKAQDALQDEYGKMSSPSERGEYFGSSYKVGRFSIRHILWPNKIEQVVFARDDNALF